MTISPVVCAALAQAESDYGDYVKNAVVVVVGSVVEPPPHSVASAVVLFEVIHNDSICQTPLADAYIQVSAQDDATRFVAPEGASAGNYVSFWHRESAPEPGNPGWAPLGPGQVSLTHEVSILGQTLPEQLTVAPGAGYLHYVGGIERGDGWTVGVGVTHPDGVSGLQGLGLDLHVSARPYFSPATPTQPVSLVVATPLAPADDGEHRP